MLHFFTGALISVGGAGGEFVGSAMDIRIVLPVVLADTTDHRFRLLGGGGVVEPDQRVTVDVLVENWEIAADLVHVVRWCCQAGMGGLRRAWVKERVCFV